MTRGLFRAVLNAQERRWEVERRNLKIDVVVIAGRHVLIGSICEIGRQQIA